MIRIIKYPIYSGLFFGSLLSFSQESTVVNTGELYVSEKTEVVYPFRFENKLGASLINNGDCYFRGDLKNDGTFITDKKGYIIFDGKNRQIIGGEKDITTHDILFDNPTSNSAFELENKLNVSGTANFHDGVVYVHDNAQAGFILGRDSEAINAKDKSHVDGFVQKRGKKEFTFPIGNGEHYRYAKISAPKDLADNYSSRYYFENSNDRSMSHTEKPEDIVLINNTEYWKVERKAGNGNIMLTLEWDENTTQKEIFAGDLKNILTIVRWNEEKGVWEDQVAVSDDEHKTLTAPVNGYGVFTIARKQASSLELDIYNAVILKDADDHFVIGQLENYDSNTVEIYNRWGVKVFETKNYGDTKENVFKGYSKGRVTMQQGEKLPAGTYYYIINCEYKGSDNKNLNIKKAGYLHLENE